MCLLLLESSGLFQAAPDRDPMLRIFVGPNCKRRHLGRLQVYANDRKPLFRHLLSLVPEQMSYYFVFVSLEVFLFGSFYTVAKK